MRKLKTKDIPALCRVIRQPMVTEKIREIAQSADNAQEIVDVWGKGFDVVAALAWILGDEDTAKAAFEFLAGPFEIEPADVEELELKDLVDRVKQLIKENDLADFFGAAARAASKE